MEKNKTVYIIGGGYSLKGFNFNKLKNKDTIVINKVIKYVPNPTYFITIDYTALKKISSIKLDKTTKVFIANFAHPYMKEEKGYIIDKRTNLIYDLTDFDMIIKSHQFEGIGFNWNDFRNGNNSGYCALQLAILLGYKNIYLLGIDLCVDKKSHFHEGYGRPIPYMKKRLNEYTQYFIPTLKQLKKENKMNMYSCSVISKLNDIIPYIPLEKI